MSGRILTERLLATSSLAALLLATAGLHDANAVPACSTTVAAGSAYSNSGSIPCVAVTTSAISVTNTASGTIGPPNVRPLGRQRHAAGHAERRHRQFRPYCRYVERNASTGIGV